MLLVMLHYLAQNIRMCLYDGMASGLVALDGTVYQAQAKAHIEHIAAPSTNCLRITASPDT